MYSIYTIIVYMYVLYIINLVYMYSTHTMIVLMIYKTAIQHTTQVHILQSHLATHFTTNNDYTADC